MTTPAAPGPEQAPTFEERALVGAPNPLDRIDHLFANTARRTWLGVLGLAILMAAAVTWTAVAEQKVVVDAPAVIVPREGIFPVASTTPGVVTAVRVSLNQRVARGQELAVVQPTGRVGSVALRSPVAGKVLSIDVRPGDAEAPGVSMFRIVPLAPAIAVALYPAAQVSQLAVGDPVAVTVNGLAPSEFGRVVGTISDIGATPVSEQRLQELTGDTSLTGLPARLGPLREVQVTFTRDASTRSGLSWAGGAGPDGPIQVGVGSSASITVARQTLLARAFGR